jgi:hypothetical protein
MGTFLFWLILPYLIAAFVSVARQAWQQDHRSALRIGRDAAEIARKTLGVP